ncbi:hypothetical protein BJ878DRAFT_505347 [Calycina marina]|uniref:Secreted protein n=1 Tax=Calycina marina TaxID=1763456 RepID=A0A9P7Z3H2_9HELO|nr:hypothetical protein BJ878DRAFT_505347 [Calycina marina]
MNHLGSCLLLLNLLSLLFPRLLLHETCHFLSCILLLPPLPCSSSYPTPILQIDLVTNIQRPAHLPFFVVSFSTTVLADKVLIGIA